MSSSVLACAAVVALGLAGCDSTFDIRVVPDPVPASDAAADAPGHICLEDTFDDALNPVIWTAEANVGAPPAAEGGQLVIRVPESTSADLDPYAGIHSVPRDFSGVTAEVEVVGVPDPAESSEMIMQLRQDSMNSYQFMVQRNKLVARKLVAGTVTDMAVPYDPAQHRFIRMRHDEAAMQIVYEARGADTAWREFLVASAPFPLTSADFHLLAGSFNIAPEFAAVFDNVLVVGRCSF